MGFLNKLTRGLVGREARARGKEGARAYGIGDIHGRLDLLETLLARIEADIASRPRRRTYIVFLGDLIDRGPDSSGVIERLRQWRPRHARPIFLGGNHEEVLLRVVVGGDARVLADWLKFGGAECLQSYGLDPDALRRMEDEAAIAAVRAAVPRAHVEFLEGFADTFRFGDYLFVHAGIRPGVAVEEQERQDLRWIREPFLSDAKEHGMVVVHGHTIVDAVEERANRIAIDTGAYRTGILTAIGLEEEQRWFLSTAPGASHPASAASVNAALR
ncbi:MAG: serine/threonine protein phosphatase [Alphaproteobacteria bacterium]|nr:serine/threonine protein phosphatase [Alphaproteobacteria bacterium]MBV9373101.1 serine/threonine protein phosphatase [Alphaproteobacteria bacterium]MBV9902869.1 serine/threonine protein phosphatase [Alphaproteobacteria bacterium]